MSTTHLLPHETPAYFGFLLKTTEIPNHKASDYHLILSGVTPKMINTKDKIDYIIEKVCDVQRIDRKEVLTLKSREVKLCMTRNLITYFAKKYTNTTLKRLAIQLWEGAGRHKDHSTVIHNNTRCQDDIDAKTNKCNFYENYLTLKGIFEQEFENK